MPKIRKPLKTIEENFKWKNLKTIDTKTKKVSKNIDLEKLAEKWKLPWYEVVKPRKIEKYLRAKKDEIKMNNLDPKIKIVKPRKICTKRTIKKWQSS